MQLRDYQRESVDAAFNYLCNHSTNPVISLPTGAGKSLVIAELARRAVKDYAGRVIILQHRKELVEQNADKVSKLLEFPVGINSAGLGSRDTDHDVVLCGIQSVHNKAGLFGKRNLVIIDEVHLVPNDGEGMYRTFLDELRQINPGVRVVGLTATPYRTGEGSICCKTGLFKELCYDAPVKKLIDDGYLSRLTNKLTKTAVDTSKLHTRKGEFIQSEVAQLYSDTDLNKSIVEELVAAADGRSSVIVFCASVAHSDEVCNLLRAESGDRAEYICGDTSPLLRAAFIDDFRRGDIRFLINCEVLTTGFDAPNVDCVALLRATASPGLYYQIVGRGLRKSPGKHDCLILDYGGNIRRHGPIDAIEFNSNAAKKGMKSDGEGPFKECPACEEEVAVSSRRCKYCGFEFPFEGPKLDGSADGTSQVISEQIEFTVNSIYYALHRKADKPDSMRVDYSCTREGGDIEETISEWVCLEHTGFAQTKAHTWWYARSENQAPATANEAILLAQAGGVAAVRNLSAIRQGKFWRIVSVTLDEIPAEVQAETYLEDMPF